MVLDKKTTASFIATFDAFARHFGSRLNVRKQKKLVDLLRKGTLAQNWLKESSVYESAESSFLAKGFVLREQASIEDDQGVYTQAELLSWMLQSMTIKAYHVYYHYSEYQDEILRIVGSSPYSYYGITEKTLRSAAKLKENLSADGYPVTYPPILEP